MFPCEQKFREKFSQKQFRERKIRENQSIVTAITNCAKKLVSSLPWELSIISNIIPLTFVSNLNIHIQIGSTMKSTCNVQFENQHSYWSCPNIRIQIKSNLYQIHESILNQSRYSSTLQKQAVRASCHKETI